MKKRVFFCLAVLIMIVGIISIGQINNIRELDKDTQVDKGSYFVINSRSENFVWKKGALVGEKTIIYEDNLLKYQEIYSGNNHVLCSQTGCKHNTEDCMAQLVFEGSAVGMYSLEGKLYNLMFNTHEIVLYRCDFDGSNHERVSKISVDMTGYGTIENVAYMYTEKGIYLGVTLGDESRCKVLEDGSMSDWLTVGKIIYFDFKSGETSELASLEKGYGGFIQFHYVEDDKIFFEYVNDKLPQEERSEKEESDMSYVAYLDIGDHSVTKMEDRQFGDYIGYKDGVCYRFLCDENYEYTGEIQAINYAENTSKTIVINEAKGKDADENVFCLFDDNLVYNDETGAYFYDLSGKKVKYVESENYYIIDECRDFYLIGRRGSVPDYMCGYVFKEDVDEIDEKSVLLGAEKEK